MVPQGLVYALLAVAGVSLLSLVGIFFLSLSEERLHRILFLLIGFAAGGILGATLFELIPEAVERGELLGGGLTSFLYITIGFVGFFILERFIYWYHGHGHRENFQADPDPRIGTRIREFVYLNLVGDAVHNFLDGMLITIGFLTEFQLGIITTIAVFFHELPQEIGDFGLLIYGGLTRSRALMMNFLSACMAIAGAVFAYLFDIYVQNFSALLIAFAAGGFMYLAASELVPELQREEHYGRAAVQLFLFIIGIATIWVVGVIFRE